MVQEVAAGAMAGAKVPQAGFFRLAIGGELVILLLSIVSVSAVWWEIDVNDGFAVFGHWLWRLCIKDGDSNCSGYANDRFDGTIAEDCRGPMGAAMAFQVLSLLLTLGVVGLTFAQNQKVLDPAGGVNTATWCMQSVRLLFCIIVPASALNSDCASAAKWEGDNDDDNVEASRSLMGGCTCAILALVCSIALLLSRTFVLNCAPVRGGKVRVCGMTLLRDDLGTSGPVNVAGTTPVPPGPQLVQLAPQPTAPGQPAMAVAVATPTDAPPGYQQAVGAPAQQPKL